jgi:hypothetical protein
LKIEVIVRVALDEGSLGGKMTKDTKFPAGDWRSRYFNRENLANTLERVDKLKQILPRGMRPQGIHLIAPPSAQRRFGARSTRRGLGRSLSRRDPLSWLGRRPPFFIESSVLALSRPVDLPAWKISKSPNLASMLFSQRWIEP